MTWIIQKTMKRHLLITVLTMCIFAAAGVHAESEAKHRAHHDSRATTHGAKVPRLRSNIALIFDERAGLPVYEKNSSLVAPIASITKLMTAMVLLDAQLRLDEEVTVEVADLDRLRGTHSRLKVGMTFTRSELLKLALMASENRAAAALSRSYPGGRRALVAAMNAKASELGMSYTRFADPTGLSEENVSTAADLAKLVAAAREYPLIQRYTTSATHLVEGKGGRDLRFVNTNPLVRNVSWDIGVSKTGYISEAGRCLVMEASIDGRPMIIILLDSWGKYSRVGDANRIRKWIESTLRTGEGGQL
jgi:D-alanyl-D-alanine endopeptidase (penicillin-binding protein 7)